MPYEQCVENSRGERDFKSGVPTLCGGSGRCMIMNVGSWGLGLGLVTSLNIT